MTPLAAYALSAELDLYVHPDSIGGARRAELELVAEATANASERRQLPGYSVIETAAWLAGVGRFESGYRISAKGKLGEVGVWQIMPPAPSSLEDQALEAIRRWSTLGPSGYCGEPRDPFFVLGPLARNRELWGEIFVTSHPYPEPLRIEVASDL